MITDIVGYSKLSGDNQDVALELLKEHDKILFDFHNKYNGNILKNRGDGVISQFNSSSDCVRCAVEIQRKLKRRNALNIKERNLNIRIGIHYGEYVKDGEEIHGECINFASILEPLAPHGGIVISEQLADIIDENNDIYIREYLIKEINGKKEQIYEVYTDLYDWCKEETLSLRKSNKTLKKAHELYHIGDFSSAIKNTILYKENSKIKVDVEVQSFLVNLFINIGNFDESEFLLNKIIDKISKEKLELRAHILKLKGHLFFNKEMFKEANKYYDKSFKIFIENKSKYVNEVLFYKGLIDVFNDEVVLSILDRINESNIEDDFLELLIILENNFICKNKGYDINIDINRIDNLGNNRLKAYGIWLISKQFSAINELENAYIYETKSQEYIKQSSLDISDKYLRKSYLENICLHKKIMTETSIGVDDLFNSNEMEEDLDSFTKYDVFNFCVSCGAENVDNDKKCNECETVLIKEYYEKE